jgi:E3 ubiquitin-protein ligase TRAF7
MKDFMSHMEEKVGELQESLEEKDQEINFLRSMLGKLSERLENLEKTAEIKLGQCSDVYHSDRENC